MLVDNKWLMLNICAIIFRYKIDISVATMCYVTLLNVSEIRDIISNRWFSQYFRYGKFELIIFQKTLQTSYHLPLYVFLVLSHDFYEGHVAPSC